MNEQGSCYKCLCKLFNIFWCFHVENWYDNSVSINSIFIDKIDNPNSNVDNYRLLTPNSFIGFYRISKKLIDFYRLLSNIIDYRYYRITLLGNLQPSFIAEFVLKSWEGVNWDVRHSTDTPLILKGPKLGRGGVLPEKLGGGVRQTSYNTVYVLTLFQTKICDFPYPISDMTLKSISLWQAVMARTWLAKTLKGKWSYHLMMKK